MARNKGSMREKKKIAFSVAFQAPAFLLYSLILIVPMFLSLYYALLKWNGVTDAKFIGLKNFIFLFTEDRYFSTVILNTVTSMLAGVLIQLPIALVLAYMVYRTVHGFHFFQSVYFIPVVISATIIGLMFSLFFNPVFGPINTLLKELGLGMYVQNWLSDTKVVLISVLTPGIWQYIGYHFIILLAGMQSISKDIIESAYIDGANTVNIFFKIVIPNIMGMIQVCVIICLTGAIKTFDIPYIMTEGGPGASSTFLSIYMYKEAFVNSNLGRGTAIAVCMLVLAIVSTVIVNLIFKYINGE